MNRRENRSVLDSLDRCFESHDAEIKDMPKKMPHKNNKIIKITTNLIVERPAFEERR